MTSKNIFTVGRLCLNGFQCVSGWILLTFDLRSQTKGNKNVAVRTCHKLSRDQHWHFFGQKLPKNAKRVKSSDNMASDDTDGLGAWQLVIYTLVISIHSTQASWKDWGSILHRHQLWLWCSNPVSYNNWHCWSYCWWMFKISAQF